MAGGETQRIRIAAPPAPANNATVTLLESTHLHVGSKQQGVSIVFLSFPGLDQASATGGLKGYTSNDKGATWDPFQFGVDTLPATVAAATATDYSSYIIDIVGADNDIKFTFTAGATAPTVWRPVITVQIGSHSQQR